MKQLPNLVLKSCPCVGAYLCSLCVPSGFGDRARSEVSSDLIFWGPLADAILVEGSTGVGGAGDRASCEPAFFLYFMAVTSVLEPGSGPVGLEQEP